VLPSATRGQPYQVNLAADGAWSNGDPDAGPGDDGGRIGRRAGWRDSEDV